MPGVFASSFGPDSYFGVGATACARGTRVNREAMAVDAWTHEAGDTNYWFCTTTGLLAT